MMLYFFVWTIAALLGSAGVLHVIDKLGAGGRRVCDRLAAAPLLDLVVLYFTHGPWVAAVVVWWRLSGRTCGEFFGFFFTSVAAQAVTLVVWAWAHELARGGWKGPRIVWTLNRKVGRARNHLAVWWTALAVPLFTLVRLGELVIYPPLTWLVGFPRYPMGEWVNVSRQKFDGLVGYDLIWCLYCDWMTGVWSLGSEMLRNVESFWCPIRFGSPEKCENCRVDFPDVGKEWVGAGAGMAGVVELLEKKYPGPGGVNAWFGHSVRVTVEGKEMGRGSSAARGDDVGS